MGLVRFPVAVREPELMDVFAPTEDEIPPSGRFDDDESDRLGTVPSGVRSALSIGAVLDAWRSDGPLVHEPTGIAKLDQLTGGGPVYGTRWYLAGAPDAGKTALLIQLADTFAQRGVAVGLYAVDEDAGDLVTRLAQRRGYMRVDCEIRDPGTLSAIGEALADMPIRLYDDRYTIESAAADLAAYVAEHGGGRMAFLADSLQTIRCEAEAVASLGGRDMSEVSAVTARVRAVRAIATQHRAIAIVTSELGRGAYRSSDPDQQTTTLASAKWSGAVEYSARVLLGVRSVAGETDLVDIEIAKNKHGPRDEHVYLRIDRRTQTLIPVDYAPAPAAEAADRDSAARERAVTDAARTAHVLMGQPGLTVRGLRSAVRAATGMGHERVETSIGILGDAVVRTPGEHRAQHLSIAPERLPEAVRIALAGLS
jgi:KaiC/GvpD/RAD55 family RecA-like ATPase